jgi:hypothetical protein
VASMEASLDYYTPRLGFNVAAVSIETNMRAFFTEYLLILAWRGTARSN